MGTLAALFGHMAKLSSAGAETQQEITVCAVCEMLDGPVAFLNVSRVTVGISSTRFQFSQLCVR